MKHQPGSSAVSAIGFAPALLGGLATGVAVAFLLLRLIHGL